MTVSGDWDRLVSVLSVDGETHAQALARTATGLEARWPAQKPFTLRWIRAPAQPEITISVSSASDPIPLPTGSETLPLESDPPTSQRDADPVRIMRARFSAAVDGAQNASRDDGGRPDSLPQMILETTVTAGQDLPFRIECIVCPLGKTNFKAIGARLETKAQGGTKTGFETRLPHYGEPGRHWWSILFSVSSTSDAMVSVICAALRSRSEPIQLEEVPVSDDRTDQLAKYLEAQDTGANGEFALTTAEAATVVPIPATEIPGLRLNRMSVFDLNQELQETEPGESRGVVIGEILAPGGTTAGPVLIQDSTLNRHAFVCGATGSGKSETIRTLLSGMAERDPPVPWMVIEPAKAEYRAMAGRLGDSPLTVIDPASPTNRIPVAINPLEPEPGFRLDLHLELLKVLIVTAFDAEEPFPQILSQALGHCYEELGWQVERPMGEEGLYARDWIPNLPLWPTIGDLTRSSEQVILNAEYGPEVQQNILGFVRVRLASLATGVRGRFLAAGHPLAFRDLLERNVVFEFENIGDDRDKAFVMGLVILRLFEALRTRKASPDSFGGNGEGLRHILVVEEAHRLLSRNSSSQEQVEAFANILAEVRAYGEGIIVAEQIPAKVIEDVVKNTALKVMHRLPAEDDRKAVGATMNLTDAQNRAAVAQRPGEAIIFADGMDRAIQARITRPPDASGSTTNSEDEAPSQLPPLAAGRGPFCFCPDQCLESRCSETEIADGKDLLGSAPPDLNNDLTENYGALELALRLACWLSACGELNDSVASTLTDLVTESPQTRCAVSQGLDAILRDVARSPHFVSDNRDGLIHSLFLDLVHVLNGGSVSLATGINALQKGENNAETNEEMLERDLAEEPPEYFFACLLGLEKSEDWQPTMDLNRLPQLTPEAAFIRAAFDATSSSVAWNASYGMPQRKTEGS